VTGTKEQFSEKINKADILKLTKPQKEEYIKTRGYQDFASLVYVYLFAFSSTVKIADTLKSESCFPKGDKGETRLTAFGFVFNKTFIDYDCNNEHGASFITFLNSCMEYKIKELTREEYKKKGLNRPKTEVLKLIKQYMDKECITIPSVYDKDEIIKKCGISEKQFDEYIKYMYLKDTASLDENTSEDGNSLMDLIQAYTPEFTEKTDLMERLEIIEEVFKKLTDKAKLLVSKLITFSLSDIIDDRFIIESNLKAFTFFDDEFYENCIKNKIITTRCGVAKYLDTSEPNLTQVYSRFKCKLEERLKE
jgi:hypothetical protein